MKNVLVVAILALFAVGCSNKPAHFIVNTSPVLSQHGSIIKSVRLHVTDERVRQEILRTTDNEKHSYLAAQISTNSLVTQGLSEHLKRHASIGTSPSAGTLISVNIEKMALKLQQHTLSYDTKSLIIFNVSITNGANTLNKTFKRKGTSKGPLKADIAVLEQEFSLLLTQLYNDISHDHQVAKYLNL